MPSPFVSVLDEMRATWDRRAAEDALRHAAGSAGPVGEPEFVASGEALAVAWVDPLLAEIRADREPAELRVLDYGCGPGRLLRALADRCGEAHGVDVSPAMLARARQLLDGVDGVFLHLGDGMTLRAIRRLRFDVVVAHDVLPHLPDTELVVYVLRQIGYQLAPGGRVLFDLESAAVDALDVAALLARAGLTEVARRRDDARVAITARGAD